MKRNMILWPSILVAVMILMGLGREPATAAANKLMPGSLPGMSVAAGLVAPADTDDSDCISTAASATGQQGVVSCKGDLHLSWRQWPVPAASSAVDPGSPFPASNANSIKLKSYPVEEAGAWQCYKDGGPACYSTLKSVAMVSADEGWAVGYGGMVLHYLNGDWQQAIPPARLRSLESLSMLSANDGWAVGFDNDQHKTLFLHWDGNAWSELDATNIGSPRSVDMISATDGWAVGGPNAIMHWDGFTWKVVDNLEEASLDSVDMLSSADGWAVGAMGTILHWDGIAWTRVPSPTSNSLRSVSMLSSSDGWAVGADGTIVHWNGSEWQLASSPTSYGLSEVKLVTPDDGWAAGAYGTILHWNGDDWLPVESPTKRTLFSLSMLSASDGWAMGWFGTILHWDGSRWVGVSTPPWYNLMTVSMVSQSDGWAGGYDADQLRTLFLHWDGVAWQPATSPTEDSTIQSISMVSSSDGWALGWDFFNSTSDIFHWDGSSWQVVINPASGTFLNSISMLTSTDGWIVGDEGTALQWDGTVWETKSDGIPIEYDLRAISMVSENDGWAVGITESGSSALAALVHWNGVSWQTYESDHEGGLASVDMVSSTDGWAMGGDSDFLHWNGTTWETVFDYPISLSLTSIFMLSSTDGWAVGDYIRDGYSRSSIGHWNGQAWLDSPSPTENGLSSVAMVSPDEGWAVGSGAILHYKQIASTQYLPLMYKDRWYCGQDSLINGSFEQDDAGWELYTSGTHDKAHDLIGSVEEGFSPYVGDYAARLGGYEGVWDSIEQTIIIPTKGSLTYWWKMGTNEILPHQDWFSVDFLQSDRTQVAQLAFHDDQDLEGVWQQDQIDVSDFAGQELVLRFGSYNDNYYHSSFSLDEVVLCGP